MAQIEWSGTSSLIKGSTLDPNHPNYKDPFVSSRGRKTPTSTGGTEEPHPSIDPQELNQTPKK